MTAARPHIQPDSWQPTISETSTVQRWTAPENEEVWTKIHDDRGERNVAKLTRKGNLWFTHPTDGMYVYYQPTHWCRTSQVTRPNRGGANG